MCHELKSHFNGAQSSRTHMSISHVNQFSYWSIITGQSTILTEPQSNTSLNCLARSLILVMNDLANPTLLQDNVVKSKKTTILKKQPTFRFSFVKIQLFEGPHFDRHSGLHKKNKNF